MSSRTYEYIFDVVADNYEDYISHMESEGREVNKNPTKRDLVQYVNDKFINEYNHEIARVGRYKAMSMWLAGLALPVEYYNEDIWERLEYFGAVPSKYYDLPEQAQDEMYIELVGDWWGYLAKHIFKLMNALKYKKSKLFDE